jgi:dipeptidyl aminopeptidase/acylaminoacyl peptidase
LTEVTKLDPARGESTHRWPVFLPDGRHFLYLVASFGGKREKMGIYARSLDSGEEKFLVGAESSFAFSPRGFLFFLREKNLVSQPFETELLEMRGEAVPVAEDIQIFPQTYSAMFSVSGEELVYENSTAIGVAQLKWFDRSGKEVGVLGTPANQGNPRISPDGKRVALDIVDPRTSNMDIWIYEATGGLATRLTTHPALDARPIWSPDGKHISFFSLRLSHPDIFLKNADGSGEDALALQTTNTKYTTDWSSGGLILFQMLGPSSDLELWLLPTQGDRKPYPFLKTSFGVSHGQFSPDGRWVAYSSNESGTWEIYVAPFPGPGGNWKVSAAGGGNEPRWRGDGKELFYLASDGTLMAVGVRAGAQQFDADPPGPLFKTRGRQHISSGDLYTYDVSADGQRFLVNTDIGEVGSPSLSLIQNWTAEVKR